MKHFSVSISLESDAFAHGDSHHELARILRDLAESVQAGSIPTRLFDVNGVGVGAAVLAFEEEGE